MKTILLLLIGCTLFTQGATAQSKQKAEKAFLKELNNILKKTPYHHWAFEPRPQLDSNYEPIPVSKDARSNMRIDSAFAINAAGTLSVTLRYLNDSSFVRARMEVPVKDIKSMEYDLYLILGCKADAVVGYTSAEGSELFVETERTNLFHLGLPAYDGYYQREKMQKLLDNLLKYYAE